MKTDGSIELSPTNHLPKEPLSAASISRKISLNPDLDNERIEEEMSSTQDREREREQR